MASKLAYRHRDINHVLSTGQSLSVGAVGYPAISTKQPYANMMFRTGVIAGGANLGTSFVPLVEGPNFANAAERDPPYLDDETMSSGFASLVTKMSLDMTATTPGMRRHDLLVSAHGIGGIAYVGLRKGSPLPAYANGMAQVKAAFEIAVAMHKAYVVRAVTNVHGEADHVDGNVHYARDLLEWQATYENDIKALTGQTEDVPMFHSQMSSWTFYGQGVSAIPEQQLSASLASKGKLVLVGPKYNLQYSHDGVHLTNEGYRHMGEYYAKAYRQVVLEGRPWEPLRPRAIERKGNVITIKLAVPRPPLVFDEKLVSNPGNLGFEYTDSSPTPPSITNVEIAGESRDTVRITLSAEPSATKKRIRYAYTGIPNNPAGPKTGPRGNLRDSDTTESLHGYPLYNWCVHFNEVVP